MVDSPVLTQHGMHGAARALQAKSALDGAYLVSGGLDDQGRTRYDVAGGLYDYDKRQLSLDASAQGPV